MRYRSLIFPALLILAGVIALLLNTGAIPADRLILLVDLWPLILIVIGVELIIRRGVQGAAADVAAAAVVILAVVASAAYVALAPSPSATHELDATAPAGALHSASLAVNAGAATIRVAVGSELGTQLYRAHITYPGTVPVVEFDSHTGAVTISQRTTNAFGINAGHFTVDVQLNSEVTWRITENTGASDDSINVAQVKVTAVRVNTGASREDLTLGPPSGVVPVEVNGGALTVHLHRPSGTEASVDVSGGAVSLDADGHNQRGIGDLRYQSSGFAGASDGYRIRVSGGACTVTLDTTP